MTSAPANCRVGHRDLRPTKSAKPPRVDHFDVQTTPVGVTPDGRVTVQYETQLGTGGQQIAQAILAQMPALMQWNDYLFGVTAPAGSNVIISSSNFGGATDGSGGAFHMGCAFNDVAPGGGDWEECYAQGNPVMDFGLVQAEVTESYMGLQNKGWDCGGSNGEGLSRYLASLVSGGPAGSLVDFQTAPSWDQAGRPDYFTQTDPTDQNPVSTGATMVYLWWLTKLGYTPQQIVQAGGATLAQNYAALPAIAGVTRGNLVTDLTNAIGNTPINGDNWCNATVPTWPSGGTPPPPPSGPTSPPPPPPPIPVSGVISGLTGYATGLLGRQYPVTIPAQSVTITAGVVQPVAKDKAVVASNGNAAFTGTIHHIDGQIVEVQPASMKLSRATFNSVWQWVTTFGVDGTAFLATVTAAVANPTAANIQAAKDAMDRLVADYSGGA